MSNIYHRLPSELKSIIASYFYIWQRHGFLKQPDVIRATGSYYTKIRRAPKGSFWNSKFPYSLHYHYGRHIFKYTLWIDHLHNQWNIEITPQFSMIKRSIYQKLYYKRTWLKLMFPTNAIFIDSWYADSEQEILLEFIVNHDIHNGLTYQKSAEEFVIFMRELSVIMNKEYQLLKKENQSLKVKNQYPL